MTLNVAELSGLAKFVEAHHAVNLVDSVSAITGYGGTIDVNRVTFEAESDGQDLSGLDTTALMANSLVPPRRLRRDQLGASRSSPGRRGRLQHLRHRGRTRCADIGRRGRDPDQPRRRLGNPRLR